MGVFIVTAVSSVFAYVWLFLVLAVMTPDYVELWEAIVTFMFFFVLVIMAYIADKYRARKMKREADEARKKKLEEGLSGDDPDEQPPYSTADFYKVLIAEKQGHPPKDQSEAAQREEMKAYLRKKFNTD